MKRLKLILPSKKYIHQVLQYKMDMLNAGSSMDGCGNLRRIDVYKWLQNCKDWRVGQNLPNGFVASTQYICVREEDDKLVGMIDIRHEFCEYIFNYGGLIGYSIAVNERGKGYGKEILRLGLKKAKEIGLSKVLVTCLETNECSRRCILANGGIYEDTRTTDDNKRIERYWIDIANNN